MIPHIDFIQHVIDRANIPEDQKTSLKTALRTSGEIPAITSSAQYEAYRQMEADLRRGLPDRFSPDFGTAFVEWARSPEGVLALTYGEKMTEWEEQQEDDSLDEP
jgi:hypothetical protein